MQLALLKEENEASFGSGELHRELKQRLENVVDSATGIELACGIEEEVELFDFARRLGNRSVSGRKNGERGEQFRCAHAGKGVTAHDESETPSVDGSKLESVAGFQRSSLYSFAIKVGAVGTVLVDDFKAVNLTCD